MYSTAIFEGNLAEDVQIKENQAGGVYLDAVVLTNQGKDRNDQERPATRWQVRISGRTAENAANLRKGTRLIVVGNITTDTWTDKTTGEIRYAQRVLAQSVGVALTFAQVTGIERTSNSRTNEGTEATR